MSTTFISHRMFVAALNHDHPAPAPAVRRVTESSVKETAPERPSGQLTIEQLAAFMARYLPDLSFMRKWDGQVW